MGVQEIFTAAANFTGIMHNSQMQIGNVIQNAKIEVDEEGTIAVAVSGNVTKYIIMCKISSSVS